MRIEDCRNWLRTFDFKNLFTEGLGWDNHSLVKSLPIDDDGNELDVLHSAKKFLLKNSPYIIMEFSQSALKAKGVLVKNFYKFIKTLNYSIYDLDLKKITNHILVSNNSSIDILLIQDNLS